MAKEHPKKYLLTSFLVDVGKISPFSCLTLLLHLGQGKLDFFISILSTSFEETFLLKELSIVGLGVHLLPLLGFLATLT